MRITSLLDGITPDHIRLDPFPHIYVPDVLESSLIQALVDGFPPFSRIAWAGGAPPPSNSRYQLSASLIMAHESMSTVWKEFAAFHSSPAFFEQVVALFADYWEDDLKAALGGSLLGHPMGRLLADQYPACRILLDARADINTPVTGPSSSVRGPHLDTPDRLFTGLLYLRAPDDDSEGGDLELFRWRNGPVRNPSGYEVPPDSVEYVATIPYRANTLVMFPQSLNTVHGVSVRQPTPHTRRYMFISAQIQDDWRRPAATLHQPRVPA